MSRASRQRSKKEKTKRKLRAEREEDCKKRLLMKVVERKEEGKMTNMI